MKSWWGAIGSETAPTFPRFLPTLSVQDRYHPQSCETRASPFFHWSRLSLSACADSRLREINRSDELCELQTEGVGDGGRERGDRNVDSLPSLRSYWVEFNETGVPERLARDTRCSRVSLDTRTFHLLNNNETQTTRRIFIYTTRSRSQSKPFITCNKWQMLRKNRNFSLENLKWTKAFFWQLS